MFLTVEINPLAIASHLTIPPKIFTKIAVTFGSLVMSSNADSIACDVAPPPQSRKLAGCPPLSLIMSIVAIARPAPLTDLLKVSAASCDSETWVSIPKQPMSPSSLIKLRPTLNNSQVGKFLDNREGGDGGGREAIRAC